jgi:hypothetical protein
VDEARQRHHGNGEDQVQRAQRAGIQHAPALGRR